MRMLCIRRGRGWDYVARQFDVANVRLNPWIFCLSYRQANCVGNQEVRGRSSRFLMERLMAPEALLVRFIHAD